MQKEGLLSLLAGVLMASACATTQQPQAPAVGGGTSASSRSGISDCRVEIPLTSQGGGAAWAERVETEALSEGKLRAKWEDSASPWAGFGNPLMKNWQGTVDLSSRKNCTLVFAVEGQGLAQARIKLKGVDDPTDMTKNESQTLSLEKYYDAGAKKVSIPLKDFEKANFPWNEVRQLIFESFNRQGEINLLIDFPLMIMK
jgi:hypothetical protein